MRRAAKEKSILEQNQADEAIHTEDSAESVDARTAAGRLLQQLHSQERAAVVMKAVLDFSLRDTAEILNTTVGAIK